jgi:hypothetical protein
MPRLIALLAPAAPRACAARTQARRSAAAMQAWRPPAARRAPRIPARATVEVTCTMLAHTARAAALLSTAGTRRPS